MFPYFDAFQWRQCNLYQHWIAQEQHQHETGQDQLVQPGVPRCAPTTRRERHMIRVRRHSQRVVLPPVQDPAYRRIEMEGQGAACCGKAHHFQKDGPDHQLLVQDRFVPPATDVVEFKACGERARENQPEQRVQKDLPRVERARLLRCAEAFFDPVKLQQLHPFEEWDVGELV